MVYFELIQTPVKSREGMPFKLRKTDDRTKLVFGPVPEFNPDGLIKEISFKKPSYCRFEPTSSELQLAYIYQKGKRMHKLVGAKGEDCLGCTNFEQCPIVAHKAYIEDIQISRPGITKLRDYRSVLPLIISE